jgi:perosamine synthetase
MSSDRIALLGGTPVLPRGMHRPWPDIGSAERDAVTRVLNRGVLSGGSAPEAVAFEDEFARFVDARHAILTHCGTSALHLALAAAGIGTGDHVVVPAYSFVATPLAVLHAGAIPIFADVDGETGLLTPDGAAQALTERTRAIMPVHVHGTPFDLDPMLELGSRHRLVVVEDAAQAHGARYRGRPVGALAQAGGFSLQSSKNLSAGEGGIFVTNDDELAERANRTRNFGQNVSLVDRTRFDNERPLDGGRALNSVGMGWMYRGNEFMASFARAQLAGLEKRTERCQYNAERLTRALAQLPGIYPPMIPQERTSVYHKYRVRFDPAEAGVDLSPRRLRTVLLRALQAEGLEVVLWQTDPLPQQTLFRRREGFGAGWPWSADKDTDFSALYASERFPNTRNLLDGSIVLFSQSCPLIAQTVETVDRYAEAFARVWHHRTDLAAWARREIVEDATQA